jgi:hypothetical protein
MSEVKDEGALDNYLTKRAEWFSWYDVTSAEPNSLQSQLFLMLLSEMSYRVLREERDVQAGDAFAIPIVAHLLDSGYFSSQVLAVRRLLDKRPDVISLRRLLDDIKRHRHLLTREIYVSFDQTPYDAGPLQSEIEELQMPESPFSDNMRSRQRHERFDRLSETSASNRSRFDRVHPNMFTKLESWLDTSGASRLVMASHKYLAHAAQQDTIKNAPSGLSFSEVEAIQKVIVQVLRVIFDLILVNAYSEVVPMTPSGFFGQVWDGNNQIPATERMNQHWNRMAEERNQWVHNLDDDFFT